MTKACRGRTPEALNVVCGRVLLGRKQLGLRFQGLRSKSSQAIRAYAFLGHEDLSTFGTSLKIMVGIYT